MNGITARSGEPNRLLEFMLAAAQRAKHVILGTATQLKRRQFERQGGCSGDSENEEERMISQKALKRAISAAALLRYFPANDGEARVVLGEVLVELCHDDDSLELVRGICIRLSEWPGLADFRGSVLDAVSAYKFAQLPSSCERCGQTDYVLVERDGQTFFARCSCPRGRRLLAWKPHKLSRYGP